MGSRRQPQSLSRTEIIAEAFELLELEGLDGLSMRTLALRLDVKAPAIYWYFTDKADLLGAMASEIYRTARADFSACRTWECWLLSFGDALHRAFRLRRDGAKLCAMAKPSAGAPKAAATIGKPLVELGLNQAESLSFQASVISLTIGWALFEENGPMHEFLNEIMDTSETYRAGLAAIIKGFATTRC